MARFFAGRLVQYLVVLVLALTLNFMLPRLLPGGPELFLLGSDIGSLTPEERETIIVRLGLDKSLGQQYFAYVRSLSRRDLGYSFVRGEQISKVIGDRLPWTVLLAGTSLLLSTVVGVTLGTMAAWRRGKRLDMSLLLSTMFISSMPVFWLGMMFIVFFGVYLGWFPLFGVRTVWASHTGWAQVVDVARHLVMPVITLSLSSLFGILMIMRYSMVSVMGEDFILMARAKGVPVRGVMYHHAMRNALLPVATHFMLSLGFAVGGATVTETVFSLPGIGRLLYESVIARDYPVLQASFLIITVCVIGANILADLVYPLLDPRVRRAPSA